MNKVLIGYPLDRYTVFESMLCDLKKFYEIDLIDYDYDWMKRNIDRYSIIIPSVKTVIDEALVAKAEKLQLIFSPTTGIDHFAFSSGSVRFEVRSLNQYRSEIRDIQSTSELSFALLLALMRQILPASYSVVQEGVWDRNQYLSRGLSGKTLGVVGMGRIGRQIMTMARPFRMKVLYWDKNVQDVDAVHCSLEEIFRDADCISISITYDESTEKFINKDLLSACQKKPVIVNTSRGGVMDEKALCWALQNDKISGIGVDVLDHELNNFQNSPLYAYAREHPKSNIIITPHIGGATLEAWMKVFGLVIKEILAMPHLRGD